MLNRTNGVLGSALIGMVEGNSNRTYTSLSIESDAPTLRERESVDIFVSERVVAVTGLKTVFSL